MGVRSFSGLEKLSMISPLTLQCMHYIVKKVFVEHNNSNKCLTLTIYTIYVLSLLLNLNP